MSNSDNQLAANLAAKPTLLSEIQQRATNLYHQARGIYGIQPAMDKFWEDVQRRSIQADRVTPAGEQPVGAARVALEASAFFGDLLSLGLGHDHPLQISGFSAERGAIANTPAARELLMSRPSTKAWLQRRDDELARRDAAQAEDQARHVREAPATFLAMIRARGVDLRLAGNGDLTVPPGTDMSVLLPSEMRMFVEWKPELTGLLEAEAAARADVKADEPLVLA